VPQPQRLYCREESMNTLGGRAFFYTHKPQSLWKTRLCALRCDVHNLPTCVHNVLY
jgi:hypothetical protein